METTPTLDILEKDEIRAFRKHRPISQLLKDLTDMIHLGLFEQQEPSQSEAIFVPLEPRIENEIARVEFVKDHIDQIRNLKRVEDFPEAKKEIEKLKVTLENILKRRRDINEPSSTVETDNKRYSFSWASDYHYVLARTTRNECMEYLGFSQTPDRRCWREFEVSSLKRH